MNVLQAPTFVFILRKVRIKLGIILLNLAQHGVFTNYGMPNCLKITINLEFNYKIIQTIFEKCLAIKFIALMYIFLSIYWTVRIKEAYTYDLVKKIGKVF